jgi:hypothetical protein
LTAANYSFTFVDGTLTVNKAVLTVKANDASMTYGGTLPTFSAKYSGFVNSDPETVVTGTPSFTPATAPTAAGTSRMTRGKAAIATQYRTFTFKPRIPVVGMWRKRDGAYAPVDVLQNCSYNFSIEDGFAGEQRCVLHFRIPAR